MVDVLNFDLWCILWCIRLIHVLENTSACTRNLRNVGRYVLVSEIGTNTLIWLGDALHTPLCRCEAYLRLRSYVSYKIQTAPSCVSALGSRRGARHD
jgi:hypothetical protein